MAKTLSAEIDGLLYEYKVHGRRAMLRKSGRVVWWGDTNAHIPHGLVSDEVLLTFSVLRLAKV